MVVESTLSDITVNTDAIPHDLLLVFSNQSTTTNVVVIMNQHAVPQGSYSQSDPVYAEASYAKSEPSSASYAPVTTAQVVPFDSSSSSSSKVSGNDRQQNGPSAAGSIGVRQIAVRVPEGAAPGSVLSVTSPEGLVVQVSKVIIRTHFYVTFV